MRGCPPPPPPSGKTNVVRHTRHPRTTVDRSELQDLAFACGESLNTLQVEAAMEQVGGWVREREVTAWSSRGARVANKQL